MATQRERLGVRQEALPDYVTNLAIKLKSVDNAYVSDAVYQVLEVIPSPGLAFNELNVAQQSVVIKFLEEILPQIDVDEYKKLMTKPAA